MSMLCAYLPDPRADLVEVDCGDHKSLQDASGEVFVDYPWDSCPSHIDPSKLILSYHNFEKTPDNLEEILQTMLKVSSAKFYKIATMARSSLDALRMLRFVKEHSDVIGLCMGTLGQLTRILAPVVGSQIMYASHTNSILGQLSLEALLEIYHFRSLARKTRIYALIGDPVSQSLGHLYHNMEMQGVGVYCKIPIKSSELSSFFQHIRDLPFGGLSVTMPHKEAVIPFLDEIDNEAKEIGAVNTIGFKKGKLVGTNTDAKAAFQLLGNVRGKTVLVLGAGGAGRAIIYAAKKRGADIFVWNRTREKAEKLAKEFGCKWGIPKKYDILVNTTAMPYLPSDIDLSLKTESGLKFYLMQAKFQRAFWQQLASPD